MRRTLAQDNAALLDALVRARVEPIGDYGDLRYVPMNVAGHTVRVMERAQLIAVKESSSRPKDREVALELRAIEERERSSG